MTRRYPKGALACCVLLCGTIGLWHGRTAEAQDKSDLSTTALTLVPQDAAFFGTSVNLRQAWDEFVDGNFVTRLRAVPFMRKLEAEFNAQWENPQGQLAQAKGMMQTPHVRNLLKLAADMGSQEIFVYGGDDWCDMIQGLMAFQSAMTSQMNGGPDAMQEFFRNLEADDLAGIRVPTLIIGFRLSDDENARIQLDGLESIVRLAGGQIPQAQPFLKRLKRSDLGDGQTLAISLDTSLIPLNELNEEQRQVADKVIELLEGRTLSLAIGVKANNVLIGFGEDADVINSIGEYSTNLLDHPKMEILKQQKTDKLRSISFASTRWRQSQWEANFGRYFQNLAAQLLGALESEADSIPDLADWKHEIESDAQWLDGEIAEMSPRFGEMLAWSVATQRGSEAFGYDWSENKAFENAAPLSVLDYAGGTPLMLFGFKQKEMPGVQRLVDYLLDKAPAHIRRFISLAEQDQEQREKALMVLDRAWPLVEDSYQILRDKIGPAFEENETVLSFAAQWTTSTLGPGVPPPSGPLPLPEFGGACKLSNRDLFISGCVELFGVVDRVVDLVRELQPNSVPAEYRVPRPDEESTADGTRYYYHHLADAVPLDGFNPQLVVTNDVVVFGYSQRQVEDMAGAKPLRSRPAWLTPTTPVAAVSYVDFAGLVTAVRPWIEMGLTLANPDLDAPLSDQPGPIPTGNDILQIWDCFTSAGKAAATVTVSDDGPTISHWVIAGQ